MSVAIIIGNAMTDYYLTQKLIGTVPGVSVIRYSQPKFKNLGYYRKKLSRFGILTSFSIKLLSVYLRCEILLEKIRGIDIWNKLNIPRPAMPDARETQACSTMEAMYELTKDAELIILTQTIRLPEKFFRNQRNIIQVIGGRFPEYCGDAAIFWAAALGKASDYGFSITLRHRFFQNSAMITYCPVSIQTGDSIRLMRARGMTAVAAELPGILAAFRRTKTIPAIPCSEKARTLTTPTLADYIKVVLLKKRLRRLPDYATR